MTYHLFFKDYKINFTSEEWGRIVQFEFHFCQRYGSLLDKTPFEEQINLRWKFLKELQDTVLLSSLMQSQTKFTVAQRSNRKSAFEYINAPEIVSSLKHEPSVLDLELLKSMQNMPVTKIISVDSTRKCTHAYSIHLFIVMENESISNTDASLIIQSSRCYLDKYHNSNCDEIVFISQDIAEKYISEDGEIKRFHLRDDFMKGVVSQFLVWTSNCKTTVGAMDVDRGECSMCFSISETRPLSLNNFEIMEEWSTSVPIHVQIVLETFINKDTIRRSDNQKVYIEEKLRILYGLYDSLLHLHSKNFVGVYQERNTENLIMNYKSLDTVFKITSDYGATVSLRLADQLIKRKANSDLCYYNTYIKKHSIEYESNVGIKTSNLNLRKCILTLMLDNLVKLRYHADPNPGESRSQQLCTLPIINIL